jgi:hypothetical protein
MKIVTPLLREFGETDDAGRPPIGGLWIEMHDGYLVCPWLMPNPVPGVAEFAVALQEQTGCVLAEVGSAVVVDRDSLLSQSCPKQELIGEPGGQAASGSRGR